MSAWASRWAHLVELLVGDIAEVSPGSPIRVDGDHDRQKPSATCRSTQLTARVGRATDEPLGEGAFDQSQVVVRSWSHLVRQACCSSQKAIRSDSASA